MSKGSIMITNGQLVTPFQVTEGTLVIEEGIITYVGPFDGAPRGVWPAWDAQGAYVTPGLIDIHVHGGGGGDAMDGAVTALEHMGRTFARFGTTGFLPSTVTASHQEILKAVGSAKQAAEQGTGGAQVLGVHLEGPYINTLKKGAQNPAHVRPPSLGELEEIWQKIGPLLRLVTLAPEIEGAPAAIRQLRSWGVTVSIGHSDASYDEAMTAHLWGASHICHTFNGMRGLHQREPGVVGAALSCEGFSAELICDGIHVHPAAMQLLLRAKGPDKIVLVTDTMRAMGLPEGQYQLGGLEIEVVDGAARLSTGELAGSTLSMGQAVKNAMGMLGASLSEAIRMASFNPAQVINMSHRKGSLTVGKDGDVAIFDKNLETLRTIVAGEVVYSRE
ncbi:MAG: N-acetylglucosamine-6-phosphate deacetylase [Firmicutes bacterium]|jgi:N-acetylglucosamine-6-phosphate deacetylase|nr:N-acetylglucosamine-6-phosphate deacetylase [Bacillota bacterium]